MGGSAQVGVRQDGQDDEQVSQDGASRDEGKEEALKDKTKREKDFS